MPTKPRPQDRHADESRAALTRLPQLADSVLRFNIGRELEELHHAGAWDQTTGRSAKTLAKYADFRIVLVSMKAGSRMTQHRTEGRISIQCLAGNLRLHLPSQQTELAPGALLILDCGIPHDVEAVEESAFLLTICWPALQPDRASSGETK